MTEELFSKIVKRLVTGIGDGNWEMGNVTPVPGDDNTIFWATHHIAACMFPTHNF